MTISRRTSLALLAAPLALALTACGDSEGEAADVAGEPIAAIAAPAGSSWTEQTARTEEGGWLVGNPDAPIKLVEYGSLTCPACAQFSIEGAEQLHGEYIDSGRVSYELRSVLIHGLQDLILTQLLECGPVETAVPLADQIWGAMATGPGAFDPTDQAGLQAADQLPPEQRLVGIAQAAGTIDFFAARGISRDQAQSCLSDIAALEELGNRLDAQTTEDGVTSTPTFLLNGQKLNELRWSGVEAALQRAGARDQ